MAISDVYVYSAGAPEAILVVSSTDRVAVRATFARGSLSAALPPRLCLSPSAWSGSRLVLVDNDRAAIRGWVNLCPVSGGLDAVLVNRDVFSRLRKAQLSFRPEALHDLSVLPYLNAIGAFWMVADLAAHAGGTGVEDLRAALGAELDVFRWRGRSLARELRVAVSGDSQVASWGRTQAGRMLDAGLDVFLAHGSDKDLRVRGLAREKIRIGLVFGCCDRDLSAVLQFWDRVRVRLAGRSLLLVGRLVAECAGVELVATGRSEVLVDILRGQSRLKRLGRIEEWRYFGDWARNPDLYVAAAEALAQHSEWELLGSFLGRGRLHAALVGVAQRLRSRFDRLNDVPPVVRSSIDSWGVL